MSTGETILAEEIVIQVPDGRSITTLVNATPIRLEDGEVESVVVTLQDMTPMEKLERLRAEFLGMVSHELRVPLTSIRGSATTLLALYPTWTPPSASSQIIVNQADYMGVDRRPARRGTHRDGHAAGYSEPTEIAAWWTGPRPPS